jgi:hypothetical protein
VRVKSLKHQPNSHCKILWLIISSILHPNSILTHQHSNTSLSTPKNQQTHKDLLHRKHMKDKDELHDNPPLVKPSHTENRMVTNSIHCHIKSGIWTVSLYFTLYCIVSLCSWLEAWTDLETNLSPCSYPLNNCLHHQGAWWWRQQVHLKCQYIYHATQHHTQEHRHHIL